MEFLSNIQTIEERIQEIEERFMGPQEEPQISFQKILSSYTQFPNQAPRAGISGGTSAFQGLIQQAGGQYGVDPSLIAAVIHQESGGNPNATSQTGAMGLMQLMPSTARSLGVSNAYDPKENILGGTRYLRGLLDQFSGNISLALAAYNAGPNAVRQYGGVPPYQETQNYVKSILNLYQTVRNRSRHA